MSVSSAAIDREELHREVLIAGAVDGPDEIAVTASMPPPPKAKVELPFWNHFLAGGISGTVGAVITSPLESSAFKDMHLRPLASNNPLRIAAFHVSTTFSAVHSLYRNEGVFALWKGIGAMIVGVMPSRAIYFASYNHGKKIFAELAGGESSLVHLGSAFCAGIATATATNPIWLVKTRMQLQSVSVAQVAPYRNSLDCVVQVVRNEGFRALYKGMSASYLGVAEGTIQWVIYEKLKKKLKEYRKESPGKPHQEWAEYFGVAAASKLVAAILTYPHEVLRTRMRQTQDFAKYNGLVASTRTIFREEGMTAFYGGMTAHLLRVVPNSAIMFFCYEMIVHTFSVYQEGAQ